MFVSFPKIKLYMKKSFALILFTLFTTFLSVKAQSDYITDAKKIEEINSRPLKVVLKKGNAKSTQEYNEKFKEAVLSEWTITDDIKFISHEEYKEQSKNKNSKSKIKYFYFGNAFN